MRFLIILFLVPLVPFIYRVIRFLFLTVIYHFELTRKLLKWTNDVFKNYLKTSSYIFFFFGCVGVYYFQKRNNILFFEFKNTFETLGFSIAILSMYGIYIGFLQYITDHNEGNTYMGKSKMNYLMNASFWYQITQTSLFIILLVASVFIPIIMQFNFTIFPIDSKELISILNYLWQTSVIWLLVIYIFLLKMSLKTIRIALLMKTGDDTGLQSIIMKKIREEYSREFWGEYKSKYVNSEIICKMIDKDFEKLSSEELDNYIKNAYTNINREILNKIQFDSKWKNRDVEIFLIYYKNDIYNKWECLCSHKNDITFETWEKLVDWDINLLQRLIDKGIDEEFLFVNNNRSYTIYDSSKTILEYLFEILLSNPNFKLKKIIDDTRKSTGDLLDYQNKKLPSYIVDFEEFKWIQIFEKYMNYEDMIKFPKFRKEKRYLHSDDESKFNIIDSNNSDMYSKFCFDYLIDCKGHITNEINFKTKELILSMNNEYRVAYILYQFLYPNAAIDSINIIFYQQEIKSIVNDNLDLNDCYLKAVDIVTETHINHRITSSFLMNIWDTRNEKIESISMWHDEFGKGHQVSTFRIFLFQIFFSNSYEYEHKSRIDVTANISKSDKDNISWVCSDYLEVVSEEPEILKNKTLCTTMNTLLRSENISYDIILTNLSLRALLYFEWILKYEYLYGMDKNQNGILDFIKQKQNDYYFYEESILKFFIVKTIDYSYDEIFNQKNFKQMFRQGVEYIMHKKGIDILAFVEGIYQETKGLERIKISMLDKRKIVRRIEDIVMINTSI